MKTTVVVKVKVWTLDITSVTGKPKTEVRTIKPCRVVVMLMMMVSTAAVVHSGP